MKLILVFGVFIFSTVLFASDFCWSYQGNDGRSGLFSSVGAYCSNSEDSFNEKISCPSSFKGCQEKLFEVLESKMAELEYRPVYLIPHSYSKDLIGSRTLWQKKIAINFNDKFCVAHGYNLGGRLTINCQTEPSIIHDVTLRGSPTGDIKSYVSKMLGGQNFRQVDTITGQSGYSIYVFRLELLD